MWESGLPIFGKPTSCGNPIIFFETVYNFAVSCQIPPKAHFNPCHGYSEASPDSAESSHPVSPADHVVEHENHIAGGLYHMPCMSCQSDQLHLGTTDWVMTFISCLKWWIASSSTHKSINVPFHMLAGPHWDPLIYITLSESLSCE
jgi:hypothetical protein